MKDLVALGLVCLLVACGDSTGSGAAGNGGSGGGGSNAGGSPSEGGSPSQGGSPSEGGAPIDGGGGAGGKSLCPTDTSEPNDSFNFPAFLNDASNGIPCAGNGAASGGGVLPDSTDADFIKIYTASEGCESATPTVDITIGGPLDICIYAQDCDEGPAIFGCPDGMTLVPNGDELLTGCCGTLEESATVRIEDFAACSNFNTQIYVVLDNSDEALDCNVYQLTVSL